MLNKIKNQLVVSCQAEGNSPFNDPYTLSLFAIAAEQGGAGGIRSEGVEKIRRIKQATTLPLIGIIKNSFADGSVCITRDKSDVSQLVEVGADMIAVDGTERIKNGLNGTDFIRFCKKAYPHLTVIADIATISEAISCLENGADAISTTLRGYTPDTNKHFADPFDFEFLKLLKKELPSGYPIIAEGKIKDVDAVQEICKIGVWSIVVGSVITRPVLITSQFVNAYKIHQ